MILEQDAIEAIVKGAPRTCGDDPIADDLEEVSDEVLPAHAGMIPVP